MARRLWLMIGLLLIRGGALTRAVAARADAPEQAAPAPGARLARRIAEELQQGQVTAAQADADAAAHQYPSDALLWRRHAQVELCLAIQRGEQFRQALDDAVWAQNLGHVVDWLQTSGVESHGKPIEEKGKIVAWNPPTAEQRDAFERFRVFVSGSVVTSFQEKALRELGSSQTVLEQRSQALSAAFADLKSARRLGDTGSELELTDLWSQVLVLFWREEPPKLQRLGAARVAALTRAIAPFDAIKPEAVLRSAAAVAKRLSNDPAALAGAADVISVVAGIMKKPDPLQEYISKRLDRAYLQNAAAYEPLLSKAALTTRRELYLQTRDAKDPDVVARPAAAALQLYNQALARDTGYSLPYLRLRLYLLRLAFEPEAARPLLEEVRRHEPGNAAVPLEEARAALLLDGQPLQAIRFWQEATRLSSFSRSYLVAVPAVLRPTLKFQRGLREWIQHAWPGYQWLFGTLIMMRHPQGRPGLLRAELQLYERLDEQTDLLGLQIGLAQRLSQAPDYADQTQAIQWLLDGWGDEVRQAEKQQLPPDQQKAAREKLAEAKRAFAAFPRPPAMVSLTPQGMDFLTADQPPPQGQRPYLWIFAPGYFMFDWDADLPPQFVAKGQ